MKYPEPKEEWVQPVRKGYKMMCCDCRLIHSIDFRIKNNRVQFRISRDFRATGQARRPFDRIVIKRKNES